MGGGGQMAWDDGLTRRSPAHGIAADEGSRIRTIAGPGTGKSFSMRRRVARLIETGIEPSRILAVTFTRIAAEDIRRELNGLEIEGAQEISARTLHSLAMRILRKQQVIDALGRVTRPLFGFETEPLLFDLDNGQFGNKRARHDRMQAYEAAFARSQDEDPIDSATGIDRHFRRALVSWMTFHKCMLLGEVIPFLYIYLRDNPASPEFDDYDHVLVDEYQDLNKVEQSVIELLSRESDVIIVGDDNQSIYSFKHAHPAGIIEWEEGNQERSDHELTTCFRCPERVVAMANSLIANNPHGDDHPLRVRTENGEGMVRILQFVGIAEEADGITADIVAKIGQGEDPGNIIVLTPRKRLGLEISNRLREAGIGCRDYLSESELESQEVTERLALLMVACDRDDRPALRWLLGYPSADYRKGQYQRLRELCEENDASPWEMMERVVAGEVALPASRTLRERFSEIRRTVERLSELDSAEDVLDELFPPNDDQFRRIRELFEGDVDEDTQLSEVRRLVLEKMYEPNFPEDVDYVRIMTLYGSKGLGSNVVYITSLVDGLLPRFADDGDDAATRRRKLEEQRRLFYVALTRVKADVANGKPGELCLSSFRQFEWAEAHNMNNGNVNARASRFLSELGPRAPRPVRAN
ncbi:ATP-dependent helicase [Mesorhizobium sp. M2C.T.Ca.TU.002.02.1.1]|uniref:ATP-dependent helicase n=1 Tax=Mesorhizobium sp. M2C.T.Ca.TU.002.02.1.1 TaxID=2496788 RepID=UPI000FC9CD72|nr:ATP-dependent helicase [Mesorhizobium sp. M2C.T.Ca.TU.002.02.1.1]RUU68709.1 ATP-dependent helicase [Mesorhizobium sp. M2C.T.Ca.TU.009.01.2.1]